MDLTNHWIGLTAVAIFVIAYAVLIAEERLQLRKSIPVLLAAGLIWILIAIANLLHGQTEATVAAIEPNLLEFAELFLFLIVAMTYVNTIEERGVFDAIRVRLARGGLSLAGFFWVTGALAFLISPFADNLTTALLLGTIAIAVGRESPRFTTVACINIVVAANAGGVFSPFGDITTLMVWQKGVVGFSGFFPLIGPALVNWLVPATIMSFAIGNGKPTAPDQEESRLKPGGRAVVGLFAATIVLTVVLHTFLDLPAALGMMTGLGVLKLYSYAFNRSASQTSPTIDVLGGSLTGLPSAPNGSLQRDGGASSGETAPATPSGQRVAKAASGRPPQLRTPIRTFRNLERIEWDTLLFFYGVILAIGGLGTLGYLTLLSSALYGSLGATAGNVLIGVVSAVIDNVPVMFAVLSMNLTFSPGEWLLVTLTTGVGGSLLSIGSAAGVALMGQARGVYTFSSHLKWSWAIALGYLGSVGAHLILNQGLF